MIAGRSARAAGRWLLATSWLVAMLGGCADDDYDASCLLLARTGYDPETLGCVSEEDSCYAEGRPVGATWGPCGVCAGDDAAMCASNPGCRAIHAANCLPEDSGCVTSYVSCAPVDRQPVTGSDCFAAADGLTCSRDRACTAWHDQGSSWEPRSTPVPRRPFVSCTPAGVEPGLCTGAVTCAAAPPACDAGFVPGIANGCYTGACLVESFCASIADIRGELPRNP